MSFSISEYTKIDVGWGFAPDPTGELTALHRPRSWFQGGSSRRMGEGKEGLGEWEEGDGGERERRGKGGSWGE